MSSGIVAWAEQAEALRRQHLTRSKVPGREQTLHAVVYENVHGIPAVHSAHCLKQPAAVDLPDG